MTYAITNSIYIIFPFAVISLTVLPIFSSQRVLMSLGILISATSSLILCAFVTAMFYNRFKYSYNFWWLRMGRLLFNWSVHKCFHLRWNFYMSHILNLLYLFHLVCHLTFQDTKKCHVLSWRTFNCKAYARVNPKVSVLAASDENCKWYSSLPLDAVVSLFCESI